MKETIESKKFEKSDKIIDRLYLASRESPMTIKNFRIVFKFVQKTGKYDLCEYNSDLTKKCISSAEIRSIFDNVYAMEDCSYQDMKIWTIKRLLLFIIS